MYRHQFNEARPFSEGLAAVRLDEKYFYIDVQGRRITAPRFDMAMAFSEGLAAVEVGRKWGYINLRGEFQIKPRFDKAGDFEPSMRPEAHVKIGEKEGHVDSYGHLWSAGSSKARGMLA